MDALTVLHYKDALQGFWREWFNGYPGREVFQNKTRLFIKSPKQFLDYVEDCKQKRAPCWVSVQPFRERNQVAVIEKLFFDFDSERILRAWKEANRFTETIRRSYNVDPLLVFSGRKGYHCYVFLQEPISFEDNNHAKIFYETAQKLILKGLKLETLDMQVVGDTKRLARVPYSVHEKTGYPCTPLTVNHTPCLIFNMQTFRERGLSRFFVQLCLRKTEQKTRKRLYAFHNRHIDGKVRPCIEAALSKQLKKHEGHLMRLAIVREYQASGLQTEQIVQLFASQPNFNPEKTRYYVEHARKNPAKPFKCKTIRSLGFCLADCSGIIHEKD